MNNTRLFILITVFIGLSIKAQENFAELQKFNGNALFNLVDSTCVQVDGDWTGEEVQYDPTQSFIKFKFKVVFKLKQEGNRVYGTSYIEDKFRGSHGDMKIRGMVIGNKLHFEEYEIVDEKFYQQGVVWCFRSGEMDVKREEKKIVLEGLSYNGYASDTYARCTDYAKMSVSKQIGNANSRENNGVKVVNGNYSGNISMHVFPNPCSDLTLVSYELKESSKVRIDIFNLSGALVETILNDKDQWGSQRVQLNLSAYSPGVYLIRLMAGNSYGTGQIVKTR